MYRNELKILDCTIRDGGLVNKWQFPDAVVRDTYAATNKAGIDYLEIGYKASKEMFDPKEFGTWRFCDEDDVKKALEGIELKTKLACMVDIGRVNEKDIVSCSQSVFDMIRIACYVPQIDKAIDLANMIEDKGYETTINIMAVSTNLEKDIDEALTQLSRTRTPYVYLSDTYGFMYSEDISFLVNKYRSFLPNKTIGMHTHNNRQLAFANTIQAIIDGVNIVDGSLLGMGRGAGNCPLELLVGFLKNPKYDLRPILQVIQDHYIDLRKKYEWGYLIPYMLTGTLNEHPRSAIELRSGEHKDNYVAFYDTLTTPEVFDKKAAVSSKKE